MAMPFEKNPSPSGELMRVGSSFSGTRFTPEELNRMYPPPVYVGAPAAPPVQRPVGPLPALTIPSSGPAFRTVSVFPDGAPSAKPQGGRSGLTTDQLFKTHDAFIDLRDKQWAAYKSQASPSAQVQGQEAPAAPVQSPEVPASPSAQVQGQAPVVPNQNDEQADMELAKAKHAVRVDNDGIITHVIPEWANDTHILPYGNSALDSALPELRRIAGIYHYTNDPYYRQMYIDLHNKTMESLAGEGLSIYTPNKDRLVEALNLYLNTKPVNPELQTWDPIENKLSTISGRWNNARYFGKGYDRHETLVPSLKGAFLENTSLSRPFGGVLSAVSNTPANMTQSNALMFQIEKYITQLKLSRSPQAYVKLRNLLWGFGIDFKNNTATLRNDFENDDTARRIALAVQERINTPPDEVSYAGQPEPFTGPHTQEIFNSNRNTVRQAPYNEYETPYFDYRQTWRRQ